MNAVTKSQAHRDRMAHAYRYGIGYVEAGRLELPANKQHPREKCEPSGGALDGSLHWLQPPMGHPKMTMHWHTEGEWAPLHPAAGKRIGYTSEYLAAHGWTYVEPWRAVS